MLICQNVNSENEQGYRTGDVSKHEETILSTALFSFFHDAPGGGKGRRQGPRRERIRER